MGQQGIGQQGMAGQQGMGQQGGTAQQRMPDAAPSPQQQIPGAPALPGGGHQALAGQPSMPGAPGPGMGGQGMAGHRMPGQAMPGQEMSSQEMPGHGMPGPGVAGQGMSGPGLPGQQSLSGEPSMPGLHAAPGMPSGPPSAPGLPDPRARGAHAQQSQPREDQGASLYQAPPATRRLVPRSGPRCAGQQRDAAAADAPGSPGPGLANGQPGLQVPAARTSRGPMVCCPPSSSMPGQYPSGLPAGPGGGPAYVPPQGSYNGPQPSSPGAPVSPGQRLPLADAVQAAHAEGFEFGQSVAREAPALWLEAVLARKPRMPSDLEARLLQDSALPIDSLLHDETRHALRRGFWDALERSRR